MPVRGIFAAAVFSLAASLYGTIGAASENPVESQGMSEVAMTDDAFWAIIAKTTAYESDQDRQLDALRQALRQLSASDIVAFELAFHREQLRAYTWDLWGAAYVINGGASDDGFEYFRRWLISRGRKVFESAVANPDSLASLIPADAHDLADFEGFAYVAGRVWQEKTGINPWKDPKATFPYSGAPPAKEPSGTPFKEDDSYLKSRYPKLWARFGTSPLN